MGDEIICPVCKIRHELGLKEKHLAKSESEAKEMAWAKIAVMELKLVALTADNERLKARLTEPIGVKPAGSLLHRLLWPANFQLTGCYCNPGHCMAPVIMGRQMPCLDPEKAARSGGKADG